MYGQASSTVRIAEMIGRLRNFVACNTSRGGHKRALNVTPKKLIIRFGEPLSAFAR